MSIHVESLRAVVRHYLASAGTEDIPQQALGHLTSCARCQQRLRDLVATLQGSVIPEETQRVVEEPCPRWEAQLELYAATQADGHDAARMFPLVAEHVRTCPACQSALLALSVPVETTGLLEEASSPDATSPAVPQSAAILTGLRASFEAGQHYLLSIAEDIKRRTTTLAVSTADLLLAPRQRVAPVHRGFDRDKGELLAAFALDRAQKADLTTRIEIRRDVTDAAFCIAEVEVTVPSLWPDYSGVEVVMSTPSGTYHALTGRQGIAAFHRIPRPDIENAFFTVTHSTRQGEDEQNSVGASG